MSTTSITPDERELPEMISVDDHVMEPKDLWQRELPASLRDRGPRTVREKVRLEFKGGHYGFERGVEDGHWCDIWLFDDLVVPTGLLHGPAGVPREEQKNIPTTYEDLRPGTYDQTARLEDMTLNHVEAALNYPNVFPRFAGQGFLERADKDLALTCLRIYNDWMIDEWSAGAGKGRLIPLTLVPLWDPQLAADEVRRCAAKGSYAIAFSENPSKLGCPSLYTGDWDVLWQACQDTETIVSMHIGSSSSMPSTSPDAPLATSMSLYAQNAQGSLCDWIFSGTLSRFDDLRISFAESQVGWMPFQLERMDSIWREGTGRYRAHHRRPQRAGPWPGLRLRVRRPPRPQVPRRRRARAHPLRDRLPPLRRHLPQLPQGGPRAVRRAGMDADACYKVLRGNAIEAYGLHRFGITT